MKFGRILLDLMEIDTPILCSYYCFEVDEVTNSPLDSDCDNPLDKSRQVFNKEVNQ